MTNYEIEDEIDEHGWLIIGCLIILATIIAVPTHLYLKEQKKPSCQNYMMTEACPDGSLHKAVSGNGECEITMQCK